MKKKSTKNVYFSKYGMKIQIVLVSVPKLNYHISTSTMKPREGGLSTLLLILPGPQATHASWPNVWRPAR